MKKRILIAVILALCESGCTSQKCATLTYGDLSSNHTIVKQCFPTYVSSPSTAPLVSATRWLPAEANRLTWLSDQRKDGLTSLLLTDE